MKRYECHYGIGGFDGMREKADGDYVSHADAEAEISKLRAECDRLKALAGNPPVLEAHEVVKPGYYWNRKEAGKDWGLVDIDYDVEDVESDNLVLYFLDNDLHGYPITGQFIAIVPAMPKT